MGSSSSNKGGSIQLGIGAANGLYYTPGHGVKPRQG
jgi:hypothetical protein